MAIRRAETNLFISALCDVEMADLFLTQSQHNSAFTRLGHEGQYKKVFITVYLNANKLIEP